MFVQRSWQVLQFKGGHVLIEIPVNLSKLLIHPVVTYGLSHAKMISEQGQNILTVHRQKIVALQNKTLNKTIKFET